MEKDLTIVVVNDAEKDPSLIRYCLQGLLDDRFNGNAVRDRCQVIVLNQDPNVQEEPLLSASPLSPLPSPFELVDAGSRVVAGRVLWDLVASLRAMRPMIRGRYLMLMHKEEIACPGMIAGMLDYAASARWPHVLLGNLRRPGSVDDIRQHGQCQCSEFFSNEIRRIMDKGEVPVPGDASEFGKIPDVHWLPSRDEQATLASQRWIEDLFAMRVDWMDAVRFTDHGRPHLFFQDVYDLMGVLDRSLQERGLAPVVRRVPLSAGRAWHLHHPRGYPALSSPAVASFFQALGSDLAAGTLLAEPATFAGVAAWVANPCDATVCHHRHPRHSRGGTVHRYQADLEAWLDGGGGAGEKSLRDYYGDRGDLRHPAHGPAVLRCRPGDALVVAHHRDLKNPLHPLAASLAGLRAAAIPLEVVSPPHSQTPCWPLTSRQIGAVFLWNGAKDVRQDITRRFRDAGVPVFILERGFFNRHHYAQVDPCGFNHTASWACREELSRSAPPHGAARFVGAFGCQPVSMNSRDTGYVLVLGQVPRDAQLQDAEVQDSEQLLKAVLAAVPAGTDVLYRPHPLTPAGSRHKRTLREDVDGARFCVTINSNSIQESLAWGCPVLALGPALACIAGLAIQTCLAGLKAGIERMMDGWAPPSDAVRDFLYTLACRQYSNAELADGRMLAAMLGREGANRGN